MQGSMPVIGVEEDSVNGVFYNTGTPKEYTVFAMGSGTINRSSSGYLRFDASKSSSVYQNNATIKPQSISILVLLRL